MIKYTLWIHTCIGIPNLLMLQQLTNKNIHTTSGTLAMIEKPSVIEWSKSNVTITYISSIISGHLLYTHLWYCSTHINSVHLHKKNDTIFTILCPRSLIPQPTGISIQVSIKTPSYHIGSGRLNSFCHLIFRMCFVICRKEYPFQENPPVAWVAEEHRSWSSLPLSTCPSIKLHQQFIMA